MNLVRTVLRTSEVPYVESCAKALAVVEHPHAHIINADFTYQTSAGPDPQVRLVHTMPEVVWTSSHGDEVTALARAWQELESVADILFLELDKAEDVPPQQWVKRAYIMSHCRPSIMLTGRIMLRYGWILHTRELLDVVSLLIDGNAPSFEQWPFTVDRSALSEALRFPKAHRWYC